MDLFVFVNKTGALAMIQDLPGDILGKVFRLLDTRHALMTVWATAPYQVLCVVSEIVCTSLIDGSDITTIALARTAAAVGGPPCILVTSRFGRQLTQTTRDTMPLAFYPELVFSHAYIGKGASRGHKLHASLKCRRIFGEPVMMTLAPWSAPLLRRRMCRCCDGGAFVGGCWRIIHTKVVLGNIYRTHVNELRLEQACSTTIGLVAWLLGRLGTGSRAAPRSLVSVHSTLLDSDWSSIFARHRISDPFKNLK